MNRELGRLLLDTLRLTPAPGAPDFAARWTDPIVEENARAIAAWIAWEAAEQWLLRRIVDAGALPAVPATLAAALQAAARRDAKAGLAVDADTADVLRQIAALDVPCVLLKGPARRASAESLVLADARFTRDVDVLVPEAEGERLWRHFRSQGYAPYQYDPSRVPPGESDVRGPSPYHLRALVREGRAAIELHVSTERNLLPDRAWERVWSGSHVVSWQGLAVRVPSFTDLLWHALTHADVARSEGWSLRYWLDAATVIAAQTVDWEVIGDRLRGVSAEEHVLLLRWLSAAFRLAGKDDSPAGLSAVPLDLERLVMWRLAVLKHRSWHVGGRDKALEEGTRSAAGLPLAPLVSGRSWPIHLRRRSASLAARIAYLGWRLST